ncbi:uncharacterized protein LTR77_007119 [Saxophila tyrrhenica]|uniref:ABC1 atypical kinase-like domain-containing protein n=1 Tax=Saxophila tyrrhenica TaxID=1690608 RepID=A0AAV9P7R5_9PEZI|nr:hypothetical protein LTR77_007119 [Saxophila tyrrhenica]
MAGKRLLDSARLFNAGRAIAKQHIALRQQQWDVFSKTSGLAKAVKSQTDRITVTAGAAYELGKRFSETSPPWPEQERSTSGPSRSDVDGSRIDRERRDAATSAEDGMQKAAAAAEGGIKTAQDGQTTDNGSLASLRKREMQRQAEGQIPAMSSTQQPEEGRSMGQDSYDDAQEHQDSVTDKSLNQDVFYTPGESAESSELPEDVKVEGLFTAPRVSRMMGQGETEAKSPYGQRKKMAPQPLPEMVAARERWSQEREQQPQPTQSTGSQVEEQSGAQGDAETESLAKSIAQEANTPTEPEQGTAVPFEMHESRVPSSRFGRLWQYGGLATSMAFGAFGESFRRMTGGPSEGSLMMSEGNMNRLVAKLSRMRGAALKLGQMMSFQDSKILPPTINKVLQRVQDSADYMPPSQRDKVLVDNLGVDWRDLYSNFEEKPFAAASIGQVHKATLSSNGKDVAVKVQYPGVRNSIDSDLNNLALLLTASRLLPKGLYLDKTIANARLELGWECDYEREAKACMKFAELLKNEEGTFKIPTIYTEASGPGVLTAEFMTGTAVTKMKDLNQSDRDWVGTQILRLCLRELMEWRFMQTDPNWTNFLYNRESQKLELLDFGASRDFPDKFVEPYVSLLIAASKGDREGCKDYSIQLGYLTGHESKDMLRAHVDSIMTLAEPFVQTAPEVYDFEDQTITDRVRANIGLMLRERLAPPPEETYSLHRKLSGAFLLCARLRSKVRAREMFADAVKVWDRRERKGEEVSSI